MKGVPFRLRENDATLETFFQRKTRNLNNMQSATHFLFICQRALKTVCVKYNGVLGAEENHPFHFHFLEEAQQNFKTTFDLRPIGEGCLGFIE